MFHRPGRPGPRSEPLGDHRLALQHIAAWSPATRFAEATVDLRFGQKRQAKLADLNLVAVDQHRRIHRLPVHVGAVEATDVDNVEFVVLPPELRMPACGCRGSARRWRVPPSVDIDDIRSASLGFAWLGERRVAGHDGDRPAAFGRCGRGCIGPAAGSSRMPRRTWRSRCG